MTTRLPLDARRWSAVASRDPTADGTFFYGVRSTGVMCRPGCASRTPKRAHVEFFDTLEEAERTGYRRCKRCTPGAPSLRERLEERIVNACRRLESEEPSPTLDELAAEADLSRPHFQRVFKRFVGLTPKQYARTRRGERFRAGLERADSVTEAIYEARFGSSRRAYEGASDQLGMTPSAYRKGAAGLTMRYGLAVCSLGWSSASRTPSWQRASVVPPRRARWLGPVRRTAWRSRCRAIASCAPMDN